MNEPTGTSSGEWGMETAREYLKKHFAHFSPETLGDLARKFDTAYSHGYATGRRDIANEYLSRLRDFITAAEKLSVQASTSNDKGRSLLMLGDVNLLLNNFAHGHNPDHRPVPLWISKDCVGYLIQRGWVLAKSYSGLHRRGYFIPREAIINCHVESMSGADSLEAECSQRTDMEMPATTSSAFENQTSQRMPTELK